MSLKEHPHYENEIIRLSSTIDFIKYCIQNFEESKRKLKGEIREAFIEQDFLESSLSYAKMITGTRLLDTLEKNYHGFLRSIKKPYFCRIDFKPDDSDKVSELYIGKISIPRVEEDEPLIVDWRAPIASVYYDGMPGTVSYKSHTETMHGELSLKRQYTIKDSILENILDVDITTTDAFLQAALGENKDNKLKDIVCTIQTEQNEVIRTAIETPLVVQGVAGSGKTTIALHRIAYLLYTYEETFDPDNFMIVAPNRLFLNYISEVLPDLGVEQVKQTTFIDLFYEMSGISYKLLNPDEKLINIINSDKQGANNGESFSSTPLLDSLTVSKKKDLIESIKTTQGMSTISIQKFQGVENTNDNNFDKNKTFVPIKTISKFKGTLAFRDMIDRYVEYLEQNFVPEEGFHIEGYTIYSNEEIKSMMLKDFSKLPLYKRTMELKKALSIKLKREKKKIIENVENKYDKQIAILRRSVPPTEKRRKVIVSLIDARDDMMAKVKKESTYAVKKYLSLFPKRTLMNYYEDLMTNEENIIRFIGGDYDHDFTREFCYYSRKLQNDKKIEIEDMAALLYLKNKIFGFDKKANIKYIVIDEAQDFSLFSLFTLKKVFNTKLFTLLGDLAQGIHSYRGVSDWKDVLNYVFEGDSPKFLTLLQSYRTTIEIMNMANQVLEIKPSKGLVLAKPVVRNGEKPTFNYFDSEDLLLKSLAKKVETLKQSQFTTIAIICKTIDECKIIKNFLDKKTNIDFNLLNSEDNAYEGGTVILPAYLSKGLEFDAVIIVSINEDFTEDELDIKLLYVAMTRALHKVDIYSCNGMLEILHKINDCTCLVKT